MSGTNASHESPASLLCKTCGLCCTGHLFIWTKLRSVELDPIQSLGLKVFREPARRGFSQPCPLWDQICTIYAGPQYPRFCRTYKCKLLRLLLEEVIPLPGALTVVRRTKDLIETLEALLPASEEPGFRERLAACLEQGTARPGLQDKVKELLGMYESQFGVQGV